MTKLLIILSIIFNFCGLGSVADKFDLAVIRSENNGVNHVAEASNIQLVNLPQIMPRPTISPNAFKPNINSYHYLLADPDNASVIINKDAYAKVPVASTTKIMTAIVVLENYNLSDIVTVPYEATVQIPTVVYLNYGEKITVESLLNCLLIKSGNDSAYALASHMNSEGETGITKFIQKMNEKAQTLGMKNTHFEDPAGLNDGGYSTAFDLYLATRYALKNPIFASIVKKDKEAVRSVDGRIWHTLENSNRLVNEYHYPGALGVKTGYTIAAGHCLVAAAERDDHTLISVVLKTYLDAPSASADESKKLLDWGFANITWD